SRLVWDKLINPIRPLDYANTCIIKVFLSTNFKRLPWRLHPVAVKMIERQPAVIFINERVSWRLNTIFTYSKSGSQSFDKMGFPGSKRPLQTKNISFRPPFRNLHTQ